MLRDMFRLPALIMFVLGVLFSGTVMSVFSKGRSKVTG